MYHPCRLRCPVRNSGIFGEITFQNKPSEFGKLITKCKKYCIDGKGIRSLQWIYLKTKDIELMNIIEV